MCQLECCAASSNWYGNDWISNFENTTYDVSRVCSRSILYRGILAVRCSATLYQNSARFLDSEFHYNWIGCGGSVAWPARSPDLNPLNYLFWGFAKDKVYTTPPACCNNPVHEVVPIANHSQLEGLIKINTKYIQHQALARPTLLN